MPSDELTNNNETVLSAEDFTDLLRCVADIDFSEERKIAVALSGGPDSMVLAYLLCEWSALVGGPEIVGLGVDHGLRAEAADELAQVQGWTKDWAGFSHVILKWEGEKPTARVQEEARRARYALMEEYCVQNGITYLCLAHHREDQAETFLFRLAKGSGIDGLSCMRALQKKPSGVHLLRPFLGVGKEDLITTLDAQNISYVCDPSNENSEFARVRLRQARDVLEAEGFNSKRLYNTTKRLSRASQALAEISQKAYQFVVHGKKSNRIVLDFDKWMEWPEEIQFRVFVRAVRTLGPEHDYGPRMEKLEALFADLRAPEGFKQRSLGGVLISYDEAEKQVILIQE